MLPTPTRTPPFQRRRYVQNSNEKDNGEVHNDHHHHHHHHHNNNPRRTHQSRRPFQDIPVNPFSQSNNYNTNNYPGLDHAFDKQSSIISATTPDRSSSIISPPPSDYLNMSIGARAAINEHTRHVAKYGLDGSFCNHQQQHPTAEDITPTRPSPTKTNYSSIMKDEEWDRLMDGSISHASFSSTFLVDNNRSLISHALSTHHGRSGGGTGGNHHNNHHHHHHNVSTSSALNMTSDQSSDFFTSSRVTMLTTPEKNKAKVDEASRLARSNGVGLLNDRAGILGPEGSSAAEGMMIRANNNNSSESISGSTDNYDESGMIGLFNAAMRFGERIEEDRDYNDDYHHGREDEEEEQPSLVSYQEPNLSLISNNGAGIHDLVHNGGIHDDEDHNDDYGDSSIPAHSFMNQNSSSPEKAPSEFFRPIYHDQESSFVSYHEPNLSIIDKQNDEPDISLIKNTDHDDDDDDLQDDTIGREFKNGLTKFALDGSDECAFNQSRTLSGVHQNVARTQKMDDSFNATSQKILDGGNSLSKVETDKDSNVGGQIHEFESQTVSDFNPIFSQINDYEDVVHGWVEKEVGSTTIETENDNRWDKPGSEIELDSNRLVNLTANYTDFPKALEESNICMLRNQYPSPEKSDFNVDVSEIRTASECDSRYLRSKVTIPRQLQSSYGTLEHNTNHGDRGRDLIRDMISPNDDSNVNVHVNRDMLGLSPISGDSPAEFDNGTFKKSLPSSTSSMLSKQHRQDSNSSRSSQQSNITYERKQSMKPHVSRLRERYSRPDRFEDSYVMSSMHNPTPDFNSDYEEHDRSISRSLLETFEHASSPESNRLSTFDL